MSNFESDSWMCDHAMFLAKNNQNQTKSNYIFPGKEIGPCFYRIWIARWFSKVILHLVKISAIGPWLEDEGVEGGGWGWGRGRGGKGRNPSQSVISWRMLNRYEKLWKFLTWQTYAILIKLTTIMYLQNIFHLFQKMRHKLKGVRGCIWKIS